ncbi:MAG: class I SAM-dependent methyltransferase, partial [Fulvivirga sp.]|nr:class I SAM-dependent methyltransferase [Fulvivirga sp.]
EVKKYENDVFKKPDDIHGVDLNIKDQETLLNEFTPYINDFKLNNKKGSKSRYYTQNGFFTASDAFFLACIMRKYKPNQIIEVGSGFSSALMLDVNEIFFNKEINLTFIEPNPERLYSLIDEDRAPCEIITKNVQEVDIEIFKALEDNDVLFIDSSHISKVGSDVNHILFNIIPVLKKGVLIHFHDITYPFEYPKEWIYQGYFWNEAYLLKAFLMYNEQFDIRLFVNYLYHFRNSWFKKHISDYNIEGGSIWLAKK